MSTDNSDLHDGRVNISLSELSHLLKSVQRPQTPKSGLGNPGPLGLGGFALTTMTLSIYNARIMEDTSALVIALALFYGGIAQFIAGLYEFRINNTFGATAFCSYGAFWCSYAGYVFFIVPTLPANKVHEASGLFLLMWLIFTLYMTVASLRVSFILGVLFCFLTVTFALLAIGDFAEAERVTQLGGAFGIATALIAWYASAAVVINSTWGRTLLPVGVWVQPKKKPAKDDDDNAIPMLELRKMKRGSDIEEDSDLEKGKDKEDDQTKRGRRSSLLSSLKERTLGSAH